MTTTEADVGPLTLADLDWVVDLSARRRERLGEFAPTFWRVARDARLRHREFLRRQIGDPAVLSVRTSHGFVLAVPRQGLLDVDDLALDDDARWSADGAVLLHAVNARGALRFVCPVPEPARRRTAEDLGFALAEMWWHRDLPRRPGSAPGPMDLELPGARGRLVDAPPVYDPGGPVLLVGAVEDGSALAAIEEAAATRGAVVSVVSRTPDQATDVLVAAGHRLTTEFCVAPGRGAGTITR